MGASRLASQDLATPVIAEDQVAAYRRNGILRIDLDAILGTGVFGRFRDAFLRAEAGNYRGHPGRDPYPSIVLYRDMHRHYPAMAELVLSPRLGEMGARLIGADHVRLFGDEVFTKLPGMPFTPWHQDAATLPLDRRDFFTIWIAVDDVEAEMGAMRYLPGSHLRGLSLTTHSDAIKAGQQSEPDDVRERLERADHGLADGQVDVPLRAGEAMIHHGLMIHGSSANRMDRPRRAYAMVLIASDTRYTGQRHISTDDLGLTPLKTLDHPYFPMTY